MLLMVAIDVENNIREGAEVARRVLRNPKTDQVTFMMAVVALLRFGDENDLPLLEPWHTNTRPIQRDIPVAIPTPCRFLDRKRRDAAD